MNPSEDIISKVSTSFDRALSTGDLLFFPSTVHQHNESGIEFQIRLCPSLQHKPPLPTPHFDTPSHTSSEAKAEKPDPFAPPYVPNLYIGELRDEEEEDEFVILLNKYSVVREHFLLVTKEYRSQASPLRPSELVQTYKLLDAARKLGQRFFAFYNCGENSGASQPHKHLQFLPIEDDGPPIERLAKAAQLENPNVPFSIIALPYANHVFRLPSLSSATPPSELERILSNAFLSLLDLTISTVRHDPDYPAGTLSYNFILTLEHMHLIPRRWETYTLEETGDKLSVNALGFAGYFLVKHEGELGAVKKEGVGKILRGVGMESVHELQINHIALDDAGSGED